MYFLNNNIWELKCLLDPGAPKSLQTVTAAMKLKDAPWKESYDIPRQSIKTDTSPSNKGP